MNEKGKWCSKKENKSMRRYKDIKEVQTFKGIVDRWGRNMNVRWGRSVYQPYLVNRGGNAGRKQKLTDSLQPQSNKSVCMKDQAYSEF